MKMNYKKINPSLKGAIVALILVGLTSCGKRDQNSPGVEFMPDMYRSPSLEYYSVHTLDGDTSNNAMLPVKGTVARGYLPYAYENTPEGYEAAGMYLKNPLSASKRDVWEKDGEALYGKFCIHCHGASGAGDGKVGGKLPGPPPSYSGPLKTLPEGKIYHSITYGKNSMGAHSSLLTSEERWKLVYYVQKLQGPIETPAADNAPAETTTVSVTTATTTTK